MIITSCPSQIHNGVWRHLKELEQFGTRHYDMKYLFNNLGEVGEDDLVIFGGGWNTYYERMNIAFKRKGVRTALLFCSPFGQAVLSSEMKHLRTAKNLITKGYLDYLFIGSKEVSEYFGKDNIVWLPQTMNYKNFLRERKRDVELFSNNSVGLFCSCSPHKNIPNQITALRGTGAILHTNSFRESNLYSWIAEQRHINFVNYDWMEEDKYYELLQSIPVHLQCSYSESFDYVVAETLLLERPVLVGPTISWINDPALKVSNVDNPNCIRSKLLDVRRSYEPGGRMLSKMAIKELRERNKITKVLLNKYE